MQSPEDTMWGEDIQPERLTRYADHEIASWIPLYSGIPKAALNEVLELRQTIKNLLRRYEP